MKKTCRKLRGLSVLPLGLPWGSGPRRVLGRSGLRYGRQRAAHVASFGRDAGWKLVAPTLPPIGEVSASSVPLTVRPDLQERGIARALLAKTMEQFDTWETRHVGLFTFPHSAKHIALYQKYGFYARFLTAIMSAKAERQTAVGWSRFSELSRWQQEESLQSCRDVAENGLPGSRPVRRDKRHACAKSR